jgi:GMP synthase (glutamine-hydrolysing)
MTMRVLSLIHSADAHSGLFGEVVRAEGHTLEERSYALGALPTEAYDAVMVFGGEMNVHELEDYPWIANELDELRSALAADLPVLGICLGGQLLAAAAGASVSPVEEPEIGWYEVEVTDDAAGDPLLGPRAGSVFTAYQWHGYQFALPAGAVALARSPACLQAFRLGERAWGLQFHPEVTAEIVTGWLRTDGSAGGARNTLQELERNIGRWNALGATLCRAFLAAARRS